MKPLLRLGLVGPLPPPAGGMANQTRQLANLLRQEGCEVDMVQVNPPYRPAWVGKVQGLRAVFRIVPYLWALWRCAGRVELLHIMANSGWSWHLFAAPAIWIARLRGTPTVVNYRGGEAGEFMARSSRWVLPSLRRAGDLAVPSGFLREVFAPYQVQATVVPNVVDLSCFYPAAERVTAPHIVVARNLEPIYDVASAVRAFAQVKAHCPEAKLSIAGTGPERGRLEQLVQELGLASAVVFTGRLDRDDMAALYRQASIMLNSSLVDNMPNSVLESLASGVPVVSTRVGGVPYIVTDEQTALLVAAGDDAAMAQAMLRLIRDPALAQRLAQAGRDEVQQYTWPMVKHRLFAVYGRLVGRRLTSGN